MQNRTDVLLQVDAPLSAWFAAFSLAWPSQSSAFYACDGGGNPTLPKWYVLIPVTVLQGACAGLFRLLVTCVQRNQDMGCCSHFGEHAEIFENNRSGMSHSDLRVVLPRLQLTLQAWADLL
jgi:hypothetical protein